VSVTLADASGNPVDTSSAATPTAEAAHGEVGAPAAQGPGRWVLSYTPPGSRGDGQDYVRARMGSLTGSGAVRLTAAGSTWVIAPKAGFAMRSGGVGPYAGLEVAAWKELAGQELGLTLEGVWWNFADKSDVAVGGLAGVFERSTHYFGLLASVGWRHRLGSLGMLWAGAGGGITRVSNDWSVTGQAARKDLGWAPVATGAVSAGLRAWRGYPFLELRVSWVRDPHIISLSGALVPITLSAGYRFDAF